MLRESKEIGAFTFTGIPHNNRMQSDFGKLRLPQPLMRALCGKYLECSSNLKQSQSRRSEPD